MAKINGKKTISVKESISYGFEHAKSHFIFLAGAVLISILANILPGAIANSLNEASPALAFIVRLAGWGLQLTVSLGMIHVALQIHDRKKIKYADLFKHFYLIIPYALASFIYGIIVFVGIILFIVPGIIWGIKFHYFSYLMVDKKMGPIDALKESSRITKGYKWKIFLFNISALAVNILGLLLLGVGLLFTIPLTMLAQAHVYRKLSDK